MHLAPRFNHKCLQTMADSNVRWAFNTRKWFPTLEELVKCITYIQLEEKNRIGRFFFREDFESSLIGRLMMRKYVSEVTNLPYNEIFFKRDERGKPILEDPMFQHIKFNVSHQGDYVVLAGSTELEALGVDVMKMEYKGGKELSEFFRIMNRQFTSNEWQTINQGTDEYKIKMFARHWCLKESYVKATGVGLNLNLLRMNFEIKQKTLCRNEIVNDTVLYVDGEKVNWEFHEMLLDDNHCAAVAMAGSNTSKVKFRELEIDELIGNGLPLLHEDIDYCKTYFEKKKKS
ncbi:L-aminoadipate-semialdehyde dehydrogenase-phosphopantetheinyl transferase [Coccinella septempunctata]|uniref:L-aminoadipate-semialdehyde dehydrogenase-phosphopantetheinyl transferase n=1 Tax=Coccinella septempunctata TaxID=41139 RepID=UPI001D097616|nr:L-aminoadipate-semialdehyde dehydrogenase-phosphopantetheinyl transferase [Coccinella septempunctata]